MFENDIILYKMVSILLCNSSTYLNQDNIYLKVHLYQGTREMNSSGQGDRRSKNVTKFPLYFSQELK